MARETSGSAASVRPPETVIGIARDLERAGFEVWCVGGAIRDALLGHAHLDWDLATNATPDQVRTVFSRKRTIPVGVEFGTVGVLDGAGVLHEVTTFRRDVRTDGRHAEVEFGASLDEDLARRDFTINAIAYSPSRDLLHDPFGGRRDLDAGLVRAVGTASERMREDRLRALRALRFASRFGFAIDDATWSAIAESAPHLTRLSAERVKQELEKTMDQVSEPSRALRLWKDAGALRVLIPELQDVSDDVLRAVDCAAQPGLASRPGRRLIRLAVLMTDVPAGQVLELTTRLRFSKHESQWIAALVERWQTSGTEAASVLAGQGAPVRRLIARVGRTHLSAFVRVLSARWSAARQSGQRAPSPAPLHRFYRNANRVVLTQPLDVRDLAIDGDDLRRAGIAPGPGLGKILAQLVDRVIEDPSINTPDRLLEQARHLHSTGTS
jgi:tRNA nucleotidyltransferase (CCA-adding enzyme)